MPARHLVASLSLACLWTACGPTPADPSDTSTSSTATTSTATSSTSSTSTTTDEPTSSPPATGSTSSSATSSSTSSTSTNTGPIEPGTTTDASTTTTGEPSSEDTGVDATSTGDPCRAIPCDFKKMLLTPTRPNGCLLDLVSWPVSPELTKVSINDQEVPKVADCASEHGWVYRDVTCPDDAIELCGQACVDLQLAGEALVEFFCLGG